MKHISPSLRKKKSGHRCCSIFHLPGHEIKKNASQFERPIRDAQIFLLNTAAVPIEEKWKSNRKKKRIERGSPLGSKSSKLDKIVAAFRRRWKQTKQVDESRRAYVVKGKTVHKEDALSSASRELTRRVIPPRDIFTRAFRECGGVGEEFEEASRGIHRARGIMGLSICPPSSR